MARIDGKVVFIDGGLPGERVVVTETRRRRRHSLATLSTILESSSQRIDPVCEYFGTCGGCSLQHLSRHGQIAHKQKVLLDNLQRIAKLLPNHVLTPIVGATWGYRHKARLGVRVVPKKGGVLVGFRERRKSYVTPLSFCYTLSPRLAALLPGLQVLITNLSIAHRIPQVELAQGDHDCALVFRHLEKLSDSDHEYLEAFGTDHGVQIYLQPGGIDSVHALTPSHPRVLEYRLPDFGLRISFLATNFTQVNPEINRRMVLSAVTLLDPRPGDQLLDLFCGIGNFTLPLATRGADVVGIEGDAELVARGRTNADRNHITRARFAYGDLARDSASLLGEFRDCSKLLLDPPRSGAIDVVKQLAMPNLRRIVYVSCNPGTLARDSEVLVHVHGFELQKTGIIDMFPHTSHIESVTLFER